MTRAAMLLGTVMLGGATMISQAQDARSQQLIHQPDDYLPRLVSADVEDHVWIYIAGLTSGANAAWIAATGGPLFCRPHGLAETDKTREVLLAFLETIEINETTILEAVAPMAFAMAYPCGGGPAL